MIPDAVLNQILDRLDIVEMVGEKVSLRRAGKNFKANCPFHQERTPSFMVNPDKQIFHCFGCGAGGNAFSFLMKFDKKDFREVVEELAERVGVEIPKNKEMDPALALRLSQLARAQELAVVFYHRNLLEAPEAGPARDYLKKRGLTQKTVADFRVGYAPASWDALFKALKEEIPGALLEKAGLVIAKSDGSYYDRFRQRVIFPIADVKGACVAFGGRVLDEALPKYLNSPETEIYSKGRALFGLYQARQAIRGDDRVIVVEGYMDLLACVQAGVHSVVASCGTALTPDQARLLKRHTKNVLILYDADSAGESATLRGLEVLLEEGLDVQVVRLPQGHDPDSFIQAFGEARFKQELEEKRQSIFDYKFLKLKEKYGTGSLEGRVKISGEMVGLFSKVPNEILRSAWSKELALRLGISEEALNEETAKHHRRSGGSARTVLPLPAAASTEKSQAPILPVERWLVGLLLDTPEFVPEVRQEMRLEEVHNPLVQKMLGFIFESFPRVPSAGGLMSRFQEEPDAPAFISSALAEAENAPDKRKILADCLRQIRRQRLRNQREGLLAEMSAAEEAHDQNRIHQFMGKLMELNRREKEINEKKEKVL